MHPRRTKSSGHGHLDPADFVDDDISYYLQALNSHARDGFIWQKLRMPRSYDYKTTTEQGLQRATADAEVPVQRSSSAKR